jgi:group I intron endonuclease
MTKASEPGKHSRKNDFYVYALLDPRQKGPYRYGRWVFEYEPFYIGKGKGARSYDHGKVKDVANRFKARVIAKIRKAGLEPVPCIKKSGLTEKRALALEVGMISKVGRRDCKQGPLTNLTDGGDGQINPSAETREKIGTASLGRTHWLGRTHTEETKQKISKSRLGKKHTKEVKARLSASRTGIYNPFFGCAHSEETKERLRQAKIGRPSTFKGKQHSAEAREKQGMAHRKKCIANGKAFQSVKAASIYMGVSSTTIRNRIKNGLVGYRLCDR